MIKKLTNNNMKKQLLTFLIISITGISGFTKNNENHFNNPKELPNFLGIPWGTTINEVKKTFEVIHFPQAVLFSFGHNFKKYLSKNLSKQITFYKVKKTFPIIEPNINSKIALLIFCNDKLISLIIMAEKLEYTKDKEKKLSNKIQNEILPDSSIQFWNIIMKAQGKDGNTFYQGGFAGVGEFDNSYLEFQIGVGVVSDPTQLQFFFYYMDKTFFNNLTKSNDYRLNEKLKSVLGSQYLFTRVLRKHHIKSAWDYLEKKKK